MSFQKNKENFTCAHCGFFVSGTGYTNHCPRCLWSKHVDIDPGDRSATCGGMMRPISAEGASPDYSLTLTCERCGFTRKNKVQKEDDMNAVIALVSKREVQ